MTPDQLARLSDEELSLHIRDMASLMEECGHRYRVTGCFSLAGDADRFQLARDAAIREDKLRKAEATFRPRPEG
jgi:hypothetical protein